MGYELRYSGRIVVSGSRSGSYPASQTGGSVTVHYSEVVPINTIIHVDSDIFEESVDDCNGTINALSGTVMAMNAAQCEAITQSTENISKSLINGFYSIINSELSSKIATLDSDFKVRIMLLMEQSKEVTNRKHVMDSDYARIASRYHAVFSELDKETNKRIAMLDSKVFSLSENVQKKILSIASDNSAKHYVFAQEGGGYCINMLISGLLRKVRSVLTSMHEYIAQEEVFSATTAHSLNQGAIADRIEVCIPVVFTACDLLEDEGKLISCYSSDYCSGVDKEQINHKVSAYCKEDGPAVWGGITDYDKKKLDKEFNIIAENYFSTETDSRLYQTILQLWNNADLATLHMEK